MSVTCLCFFLRADSCSMATETSSTLKNNSVINQQEVSINNFSIYSQKKCQTKHFHLAVICKWSWLCSIRLTQQKKKFVTLLVGHLSETSHMIHLRGVRNLCKVTISRETPIKTVDSLNCWDEFDLVGFCSLRFMTISITFRRELLHIALFCWPAKIFGGIFGSTTFACIFHWITRK